MVKRDWLTVGSAHGKERDGKTVFGEPCSLRKRGTQATPAPPADRTEYQRKYWDFKKRTDPEYVERKRKSARDYMRRKRAEKLITMSEPKK